jgi:hypothetical protein
MALCKGQFLRPEGQPGAWRLVAAMPSVCVGGKNLFGIFQIAYNEVD